MLHHYHLVQSVSCYYNRIASASPNSMHIVKEKACIALQQILTKIQRNTKLFSKGPETMSNKQVKLISEFYVRPESEVKDSIRKHYLSPVQLFFLSQGHAQLGQLFRKPHNYSPSTHLEQLKISLAGTLTHYYPLAGRLETEQLQDGLSCISVDCKKGPGAKLIYAAALQLTIADITSPYKDVPLVVRTFFDLGVRAVNYDGHNIPLLSVQITELADGVFFGLSANHCIVDGTSFMNFLRTWSEIFTSSKISRVPSFSHKQSKVPGKYSRNMFNRGIDPNQLRDRIFKISAKSMTMLKAEAKQQAISSGAGTQANDISAFQALSALVWRAIIRARNHGDSNTPTTCGLAIDLRSRLDPPLSEDYFGVVVTSAWGTTTIDELLANNLSWAAMQIHKNVVDFDEKAARRTLMMEGIIYPPSNSLFVQMSGASRMNMYGPEFGLGRAVAVHTGLATKFDGKVFSFMGSQGQRSVELHFSLAPNTMDALLSDQEFLRFVSPSEARPRL